MGPMTFALAKYVLALHHGAQGTHRAEDRPAYRDLLADAAVLLALAETGAVSAELATAVRAHERLRGQLWLADPVHEESTEAWGVVGQHVS